MTGERDKTATLAASLLIILESCDGPLACYDAALADWAVTAIHALQTTKES